MKRIILVISCLLLIGCSGNTIEIGFTAGLTGILADEAIATRNGYLLAIEDINKNGGINGKEVIPVVKDDGSDTNMANDAAIQFNTEKVHLIVGPFLSSMEKVVRTGMMNFDHLYVSPSMATSNLTGEDDNFFRVISDNQLMARDLFLLVESTDASRTIILQDMTNEAFTNVLKEELVKQMAKSDIAFLGIIELWETLELDVISEEIKASQADSVIMLTGSVKASDLLQSFKVNNVDTMNFVSTWALSNTLITNAGSAAEGLYGVGFYDAFSTDTDIRSFISKYEAKFSTPPASTSILAYDATMLLAKAIENAGSTRVDKVKEALKEIGRFNGITGPFNIDEYGDVDRPYAHLQIIDGEIKGIKK